MSAFTPGPWEAQGVLVYGPDGMIGEVGFGMRDDEEMLANARLIAAAPLMDEALRAVEGFAQEAEERESSIKGSLYAAAEVSRRLRAALKAVEEGT